MKMDRTKFNLDIGLKVGFWNINGLTDEKSSDDLFQEEIKKFDILFLNETWQSKTNIDTLHHPKDIITLTYVEQKKQIRKVDCRGVFGYTILQS